MRWQRMVSLDDAWYSKNLDCAKGRVVRAITPDTPFTWSVNSFLKHKFATFGNVHLKWYILYRFKGQRRLMSWALTKNQLIPGPYNSAFLLTTIFVMYDDEGNVCVFTQMKVFRSLDVSRLLISWQLAVVVSSVRRVCFII